MSLRASPLAPLAATGSLLLRSGLLRHRGTLPVLRRGGLAAVLGVAALRAPHTPLLVRDHDAVTGAQLEAAITATAVAMAERWPAGTALGIRGDGGIDFVVALAAAGLAGVDAMPIGPRHGDADVSVLAGSLDAVVASWEIVDRADTPSPLPDRPHGRILLLSTGTGGVPGATVRGGPGRRGMLQLADAERRVHLPAGPVLALAPPDHGHGLTTMLAALVRGRTTLLASGMRPLEQAELAVRRRPATISGVPAQLARMLDAGPSVLDGVRLVISGSSGLPPALRARLAAHGARVLDCYGTTETGTVTIEGRPLAGVRIEVDADHRLRIASPLSHGVLHDPGDLGRVHRGRLVVEGRHGDLVDSGGELFSLTRVGTTLRSIPGVVDATVLSEPDDLLGARLVAEVVVSDPALDADALTRELTARLGRAGVPRRLNVTVR
ncbi:MAG TPA: AMP-binding protein [Pseudolysinimonas sp.]|nr:AMP-binding protein [Pseudolysinimonas sp.]